MLKGYSIKLDEYKEALISHRLQNSLLIGELTVYLAVMGVFFSSLFANFDKMEHYQPLIPILAIVVTAAFYVICERAADFSHAARRRAIDLEKELNFKLYSKKVTKKKYLNAIDAIRSVYFCFLLAWIFILITIIHG